MKSNKRLALAVLATMAAGLTACGNHQTAAGTPDAGGQNAGAQAVAGPQDPNNPLIGSWRFVGFGQGPTTESSACATTMTFSPGAWEQASKIAPSSTMPVHYIPGPKTVYVVDSNGGHITYVLVDANHIALDSFAPCTYERVS